MLSKSVGDMGFEVGGTFKLFKYTKLITDFGAFKFQLI